MAINPYDADREIKANETKFSWLLTKVRRIIEIKPIVTM